MIKTFLTPYMRYLEWAVLAISFYAGHYVTVIWYDARRTAQIERVVEVIPQIIEKTRNINKAIYEANDKCGNSPIPPAVLNELRKQ
jgi:hypothetical protein